MRRLFGAQMGHNMKLNYWDLSRSAWRQQSSFKSSYNIKHHVTLTDQSHLKHGAVIICILITEKLFNIHVLHFYYHLLMTAGHSFICKFSNVAHNPHHRCRFTWIQCQDETPDWCKIMMRVTDNISRWIIIPVSSDDITRVSWWRFTFL